MGAYNIENTFEGTFFILGFAALRVVHLTLLNKYGGKHKINN